MAFAGESFRRGKVSRCLAESVKPGRSPCFPPAHSVLDAGQSVVLGRAPRKSNHWPKASGVRAGNLHRSNMQGRPSLIFFLGGPARLGKTIVNNRRGGKEGGKGGWYARGGFRPLRGARWHFGLRKFSWRWGRRGARGGGREKKRCRRIEVPRVRQVPRARHGGGGRTAFVFVGGDIWPLQKKKNEKGAGTKGGRTCPCPKQEKSLASLRAGASHRADHRGA